MVLCFDCSPSTKRTLDSMLDGEEFRDYSEVISLAIDNLAILHRQNSTGEAFFVAPDGRPSSTRTASTSSGKRASLALGMELDSRRDSNRVRIPALLALRKDASPPCEARSEPNVFRRGDQVPLEKWIFGQYNRLLPAKVSCRALSNLLFENHKGLDLEVVGASIATAAWELGDSLADYEGRFQVHTDDALTTAFPVSGKRGASSLVRFRNQFVGDTTRSGDLLGLLADLRLIGYIDRPARKVGLTSMGWTFALMPSPVLDGEEELAVAKFSSMEQETLLDHVAAEVPVEDFAYRAILASVGDGKLSPAELDEALAARLSPDTTERISSSFASTQRSGAVSRMSDLGLIARVRDGVRIYHVATPSGVSYLGG